MPVSSSKFYGSAEDMTGVPSGMWKLVERQTVAGSAVTSLTFSGLDGNAHRRYKIVPYIINAYNGAINVSTYPNNDTTANNYCTEMLYGTVTTVAASQEATGAGFKTCRASVQNGVAIGELVLWATSGANRMAFGWRNDNASTTVVTTYLADMQMWKNSANNITSIVVSSDQANSIGIGSYVELWKLAQ